MLLTGLRQAFRHGELTSGAEASAAPAGCHGGPGSGMPSA
ncbi:Hypothetical protein AA314_03293 [Archangium gephyra]|uniref:Uncharacterized protein n=1 Tax=Archangium gephyra TaxID=48 RepID=A0AAC8TD61_9BACT|nr:Hypothetical protein AA314_03293 [Archangium gephyra]